MTNGDVLHKAEVDAILSGGRPEVDRFLVESVITLKSGQLRQHELLEDHCVEANVRDERITVLEAWRHEQATTCVERVKKLISEEHSERHESHMKTDHLLPRRCDDPDESDYSGDRRVWLMWSIGSRLTNILVAALTATAVLVVQWLVTGNP